MPWDNIEERLDERLAKPFGLKISFPEGSVSLPSLRLDIDSWITSAAETKEELNDLFNTPRIQFLRNHWSVDELVKLEWENKASVTCATIWVLRMNHRAYILFSDEYKFHVIAAVEPPNEPMLYQRAIRRLLQNREFVRTPPTHVKSIRPDLVPDL